MKIMVCVKRSVDIDARIRIRADRSGIETENIRMSMNVFDEIAVEEAVRLKERALATEVIAVSCGNHDAQEVLRHALAMGADRAILVRTQEHPDSLSVARLLKGIADMEKPDLVFLGKRSTDGEGAQTGPMLAALLDWPQGIFASEVSVEGDFVTVTEQTGQGAATLSLRLPAVVTAGAKLNVPRYVSLPSQLRAKKEPIQIITEEDLNVVIVPSPVVLEVNEPKKRVGAQILPDVATLVEKLKSTARAG